MWFSIQNVFIIVFGYPLSYVEFIGTTTGLLSVWLATRSNIWTWPTGLINVTCFFLIFFEVRLYADMFLQLYFFVTSIYGWMVWYKKSSSGVIEVLSKSQRIKLLVTVILATLVAGVIVKNIHLIFPQIFDKPASYPFLDTFVAILSIVATILLAQKKIENWWFWIVVDIISVALYAKKMVLFIAIEYFVFLCLASTGLLIWVKIMRNEKRFSTG
jgi:nicotinamide mononucleotide transporter